MFSCCPSLFFYASKFSLFSYSSLISPSISQSNVRGGFPDSPYSLVPLAKQLAQQRPNARVVVPFLRGYERSSRPSPHMMMPTLATDLATWANLYNSVGLGMCSLYIVLECVH